MRKFYAVSFAVFSVSILNAQIILTQSDVPPVGSIAYNANDTLVTTSPGLPGINQTWDLTTMKNQGIDTITFITPSTSPYFSYFPSANVAYHSDGYNGGKIDGFYYANAAGANTLGIAFPFFAGPYILQNSPAYRFMTFPATYGMSITDSCVGTGFFAFPIPPSDSMKIISHMNYTENMDGWGTANTPTGSFQALRDIAIRHHVDSTFTRNSSTGVWSLYNAPSTKQDTFYFWYSNNQKFLVAEIQIQESLPKKGFYLLSQTTSTQDVSSNSEITVFPNPSSGIFNVIASPAFSGINSAKLPIAIGTQIEIRNILGEKIYEAPALKGTNTINISKEPSGIYFYRIISENKNVSNGKIILNK